MHNLHSLNQYTVRSQSIASLQSYMLIRSGPCKLWSDESLQKVVAAVEKQLVMLPINMPCLALSYIWESTV